MRAFFVRHGKDDDTYRGGWSDLDLLPEGKQQAKDLAAFFKANIIDYHISHIIASDLRRTVTTAEIIASELNLPIIKEPRLREINNGVLAGMKNEEAAHLYPEMFFSSLQMDECYPAGESPKQFYERINNWFNGFITEYRCQDKNVLVVTHGGVIDIITHIVKGVEWTNKKHKKILNCYIYALDLDDMSFLL